MHSYVAYTSLKVSEKDEWYFDSRCSRHMTREKQFLRDIQPCSTSHVTFGDDVQGNVVGRGLLDVPGLPKLEDVLLVEGLKANLISISQLCDQDLL